MKQNLLICLVDSSLQKALLEKNESASFKIQGVSELPALEELGSLLPDFFLLDMDWLTEAGLFYLETIHENFPSISIFLLADLRYQEEELFSALKAGARGWIFKQEPEKILQELEDLKEKGNFLKPFVAQKILEEFKNFASGESLLPIEEELLRKCAAGVGLHEIQKSLKLSKKLLRSHWESIWQKLNINSRAKAEVEKAPPIEIFPSPLSKSESSDVPSRSQEKEVVPSKPTLETPPLLERFPDIRKENSEPEILQESATIDGGQELLLVTFQLGSEEFAIPITQLQEIQDHKRLPITPVPRVPSFVEGIANLRGKIVPILDLRKKLGMPASPLTKDARIMVVNIENVVIGMIVDGVKEVLKIENQKIDPPPPLVLSSDADYIQGVVNLDERLILLLNVQKIATREDKSLLARGV
jgi:purine-binding chemotaxis protein CheW